ncbi:hypothetical protein REPUB_Repub04eG0232100 [Reevesia pubescens]
MKKSGSTISESILWIASTVAILLIQLQYHFIDGRPVPVAIFKGQALAFQVFVISLIFAFSAAFSSLMVIHRKPQVSKVFTYFSTASMASALAMLIWNI